MFLTRILCFTANLFLAASKSPNWSVRLVHSRSADAICENTPTKRSSRNYIFVCLKVHLLSDDEHSVWCEFPNHACVFLWVCAVWELPRRVVPTQIRTCNFRSPYISAIRASLCLFSSSNLFVSPLSLRKRLISRAEDYSVSSDVLSLKVLFTGCGSLVS